MSELEKIYYAYQNDFKQGDSEEVMRTRDSLYNFLNSNQLKAHDYEDYACDFACANEKQGFLDGFKYAMRIALECMALKGGDSSVSKA